MAKAILSSRQTQAAAEKSYMISTGKLKKGAIQYTAKGNHVPIVMGFVDTLEPSPFADVI